MRHIDAVPLCAEAFAPFGVVIGSPELNGRQKINIHDVQGEKLGPDNVLCLLTLGERPFICEEMERHARNAEVFVAAGCASLMPFAPATPGEDTPGEDEIVVFRIEPGQAFLVDKGVWHLPAAPVGGAATFYLTLPRGIPDDVGFAPVTPFDFSPPPGAERGGIEA